MRLALDTRTRRLLRRVPRTTVYSALELLLLSLLAIQCARLIWTVAAPVGPVGDWRAAPATVAAPLGLLGGFDPFFRLSGTAAPMAVTSLNLKLFGVREDRASGRGSAIIGTPDGLQRSFAVGEEVVPGVTLSAVGFDNVTLNRGGSAEQLFIDQSVPATDPTPPAPPAGPMPALGASPVPPPGAAVPAPSTSQAADLMRAAGLQPGDEIVSVNGHRVSSPEQARALAAPLVGQNVSVVIRRNGAEVPLSVRLGQ